MKKLVESFVYQLNEAFEIAQKIDVKPNNGIQNIVITGLGGSGIGGGIVKDLTYNTVNIPITLNKGYELPAFVNENTLVVVSSYSGNTEETVICMNEALEKKAHIFCVSSGGQVIEKSKELGLDYIQVPGGNSPRAMLTYSIGQLIFGLKKYGFIDLDVENMWREAVEYVQAEQNSIKEQALELAKYFYKKKPVLYGVDKFAGVTERFRQQINENSKMLCWHHIVPEMNHNELVGWTEDHPDLAVLFMQNELDHPRNTTRFSLNNEIISKYAETKVMYSTGKNQLENTWFWIHLGDWVSVFLSEMNEVDPVEVNVIDYLKSELGKS
ncbi:MAG: bifunctional phosphoglucose/phosphomannose isomerase [Flavobacteriales bacterium]|jgi:glucose/mannose-6-phosphate isomerase|nr:bifunctional phosphoglucose/phosphomannose isomerase [Flavobacteriales bacterium]